MLKNEHEAAEKFRICLKEFTNPDTGLHREAARNDFNLKYAVPDHIPFGFHKLCGYDAHLYIRELGKKCNKDNTEVIAENKEKYISFDVKFNGKEVRKNIQLRFLDTCRFMASGLQKLASKLDDDQRKHLKEFYKGEEVSRLMRCKGVYHTRIR